MNFGMTKTRLCSLEDPGRQTRVLFRLLCALLAVLGVCGCATLGQEPLHSEGGASRTQNASLLEFAAQSAAGAQTEFDDPTRGRIIVTVGATYTSGLGADCRKVKVQTAGKDASPVFTTVCQDSDKKWYELPHVMAPGSAQADQHQVTR